ncbi:MAG: CPBP family intramembrane metalloprotease [Flavobacteriaceae bacterium]|nr:CPBP family intramembrane metalloprotease [Flavobacteriaceae bacterium]
MNYIQQAYKGNNNFLNYLAAIIIITIGWQVLGMIPFMLVVSAHTNDITELLEASKDTFTSLGIDKNLYLFVMLLMFVFGLISLLFAVVKIHKRPIVSLVTSRKKIDWNRVFYGFILWFGITLATILINYSLSPENYIWNFKAIPFFILVIVSIVMMPIQTSFEELLFRGYFMQGLGVVFKNAFVPLFVTSIIFGLLHIFNPEYDKLGPLVMVYYIGTGFLFGITTLMDEGTELSLGMHAANNIVAAIFVTTNWVVLQTDALLLDISEPNISFEMVLPVFVIYPLVLFVLSKKYGWTNWKHHLFGSIEKPELITETSE